MAELELPCGNIVILDDEDLALLPKTRWYSGTMGGRIRYAFSKEFGVMHRIIIGLTKGDRLVCDHINGNGLDNRRANLRSCSIADNVRNSRPWTQSKSGYRGVHFDRTSGKWRAAIWFNRRRFSLGLYANRDEAALAYNNAAKVYFGDFAYLNEVGQNGLP